VIDEIDRRARAGEALHQSQKMEAIGQLTGGVAHDFNNVLQIIGGNPQLLQTQLALDSPLRKRIDTATAASNRGAKLSTQLLAFARRQPLRPVVINLGRLVQNMNDLLRRALGESVDIETTIVDGLWNTLADASQIENVILNLAINSRDAMRAEVDGHLTIKLGNVTLGPTQLTSQTYGSESVQAGDYVMLAVSDNGAGMSQDILQKAFEPFFTTKAEGEGTGLGLSMAYGFVKQSHGHIKVYREVGQGTTIRIYLPRSREAEALIPEVLVAPVVGGTETILVVKDNTGVRTTVVDTQVMLGYNVLTAPNGAAALDILKSDTVIDLLFTDVVMPGPVRSPDLARKIRNSLASETIASLQSPGHMAGLSIINSEAALTKSAQPEINAETSTTGLRILVVEDNLDLCELVCELLQNFGHTVTDAVNAEDAISHIRKQAYDVLLTDVQLPGISGIDLARQALETQPKLEIIFASGYGPSATANVEFSAHSLAKPYDIEKLQKLLQSIEVMSS
jgi:CheY-like chemotaxis protein/nitrogen-specific signal transduction histidine kinase